MNLDRKIETALLVVISLITSACAPEDAGDLSNSPNSIGSVGQVLAFGALPSVSVGDAAIAEGDSGDSLLEIPVELAFKSSSSITVEYSTADVTAKAGIDYRKTKGSLDFAPGEVLKSVFVPVIGDLTEEANETLALKFFARPANVLSEITLTVEDDDGPVSGLPSRPDNMSCVAPDEPTNNASISTASIFPDLPAFVQPVVLVQAPGDNSNWYVAEQSGVIHKFVNNQATDSTSEFLNISGKVKDSYAESGFLGMAFDPDYANNNTVYISYTIDGDHPYFLVSVISRIQTTDGGLTLDTATEEVLITMNQDTRSHNGGNIAIGTDGYLYIGFGDGDLQGDPNNRAQDTTSLFGSILRIDVSSSPGYQIPSDNPFFGNSKCDTGGGGSSCPEIYAWGFRNPWRWSIDQDNGDLWLGDVGWVDREEVDLVELGGNYGWPIQEGDICTGGGNCSTTGLEQPVIAYDHTVGQSITGGYVYRGSEIPQLLGRYVFADFVTGEIFALVSNGDGTYSYESLQDTIFSIATFAEDQAGELYFLDYVSGSIVEISQAGAPGGSTIPELLSDTGCVDTLDASKPAAGLIPYEINVPFWSDTAVKQRFYSIPNGEYIDVSPSGDWIFPVGSVLMKKFQINDELFETRLFMRHTNGNWAGYTYEWNQSGTDATRVIGGKTKTVQGVLWTYPSESQCMNCHTQAANFSLGLEHSQLNRDFHYISTGITANQLLTAESIGMLSAPLSDEPDNLPKLYDLNDMTILPPNPELGDASRSYFHSNCSGCHRPLGPTPSDMDLLFDTDFSLTNTCDVTPSSGDLGVANARIISPGIAAESIIPNRMNRRDVHGMPPLASSIPDANGVLLIESWINNLGTCM